MTPGISGFSLFVPPYRVQLEDWCEWNDQPWNKVQNVVGRSFRMRGPGQSVYTLAANAVWRLIRDYDIDPTQVGFLALGTESSSDNSAGAVIVKGMVNDALSAHGLPQLARDCEVPEFKQACLAGVYGVKAALRYLATDGADRQAIVVSADIAEYARGGSGEPTQGAGAVAMLLESAPRLLEVNLAGSGSDSDYRVADFRKPFARFRGQPPRDDGQMQDLPVFNGRYSTSCYIDATHHAMAAVLRKRPGRALDYFDVVERVFMHRPYHQMPATGWVMAYLFALAADEESGRDQLRAHCADAGIDAELLLAELCAPSPFHGNGAEIGEITGDVFPLSRRLRQHLRSTELWGTLVRDKLGLGSEAMRDLGNLYTAALPAWLASGLQQALADGLELSGQEWLALGYGSGDAAEALPMRVVPGWQDAAARINFESALDDPIDLTEAQYIALHEGRLGEFVAAEPSDVFVVDHLGTSNGPDFYDQGIEYYRYVPPTA
ncbi:hydroxymethylglutaryl-CoA synthase family protein [Cryobacterium sp. TMT1-21]|uniref:Hydroxymethylglutaryl-CoA synthase family protein n=1 Tax=Cryobacterium shii TaxID=1259235 RepID=A0AAQ2C705_9MICO|nr:MULTISPECIES: hydroxymethylglutaryl-CoA synthase [Cryobacterium]TFC48894.1 hydroxymethylglutaryl-CoA synthase family protein [Cryobacterium shii]TFC82949.1 hydroxymethylglutaryl-CoA synthase family protein [Cryobacterium sp. TmT2-59]TFD12582.1 hydroxymethylglutaryl-CoA synthase family protein [Cryobacterium sp. TMT1-21]TFD17235.1 hydroxymethylglutaryl-CoA synthase family protein [Cryobacterium sp. TMT4-10]TFD25746.1 hydroxymethylglutaryl-CoA synthase family protein [Cryobacterium sp. TMT2-2